MTVQPTVYTALPTPNAWVLIGTATAGSVMVSADGAVIQIICATSQPAAGSRGMPIYPNNTPATLFQGAAYTGNVYAMSPQGAGAGAFFTSTA